jgi:uncharacterized membrane protein
MFVGVSMARPADQFVGTRAAAEQQPTMNQSANLWAVGFDDMDRAALVRDEICKLAWEKHRLNLLDVAIAVRCADGRLMLNGEPLPALSHNHVKTLADWLASLALGVPPLTGPTVDFMLGTAGAAADDKVISGSFVREVTDMIAPGTSVLFVLDREGDRNAILHAIRGLGGTVLKTNVVLEHARLIQSALAASRAPDNGSPLRTPPCNPAQ